MGVASAMVGAKVKRREDPRLITGHASYVDDFQPTGLTHMVFVRSSYAHAKIKSINIEAAKKAKGVRLVLTGDDVPYTVPAFIPGPEHLAISKGKVCYVGDIVAAVIADSRGAARDAADLVQVE